MSKSIYQTLNFMDFRTLFDDDLFKSFNSQQNLYNTKNNYSNAVQSTQQSSQNNQRSSNYSSGTYAVGNNSSANASSSAFGYTSAQNQPITQHFVDSSLEGTLFGIMRIEKMQKHIYELPNGDFIECPYKDIQHVFYMRSPVNFKKDVMFKIRPVVHDRLLYSPNKQIGYSASLVMECIDTIDEIPSDENFTYAPIDEVEFKITNARQSLNDNTYRFFINGIEIASLFDDQEAAYIDFDLSPVLHFFNYNNITVNHYTAEYNKYVAKMEKKYGIGVCGCYLKDATCIGNWSNTKEFLKVELYSNYKPTGQFYEVSYYKDKVPQDISVSSLIREPANFNTNYKNRPVIITSGESLLHKKHYTILVVGGEVIAFDERERI